MKKEIQIEETLGKEEKNDLGVEEAKKVLISLLRECEQRIADATVSRQRLHEQLTSMWYLFQYSMGRMNAIRQEELWMRVRAAEGDVRQADEELERLKKKYERIRRHYSELLK